MVAVHEDGEFRVAVHQIDTLEPDGADELIRADLADREEEAELPGPRLLLGPLEPGGGLRHAQGPLVSGHATDFGVIHAGDVGRQVAFLEWAEPDAVAAQQRSLWDGRRWLARHECSSCAEISSHSTPLRVRGWMKAARPSAPGRGSRSISSASAAASAAMSRGRSSLRRQRW